MFDLLALLRAPQPASVGIVIPASFTSRYTEFPSDTLCSLLTIAGHPPAVGPPPEYSFSIIPKKHSEPASTITIEVFIPLLQRPGPRYLVQGGPLVYDLHAPSLNAIRVALVPLLAAAAAAVAALRLTTGTAWDATTSRILGALSSAAAAMDGLLTELGSTPLTLLPGLAAVLHRVSAQHASWRAEVDGWLTVPWAETVLLGSFSLGVSVPYDTPFAVAGVGSAPAAARATSEDGLSEEKGSCSGDSSDYQEGEDLLPGGSDLDDGAFEGSG